MILRSTSNVAVEAVLDVIEVHCLNVQILKGIIDLTNRGYFHEVKYYPSFQRFVSASLTGKWTCKP